MTLKKLNQIPDQPSYSAFWYSFQISMGNVLGVPPLTGVVE